MPHLAQYSPQPHWAPSLCAVFAGGTACASPYRSVWLQLYPQLHSAWELLSLLTHAEEGRQKWETMSDVNHTRPHTDSFSFMPPSQCSAMISLADWETAYQGLLQMQLAVGSRQGIVVSSYSCARSSLDSNQYDHSQVPRQKSTFWYTMFTVSLWNACSGQGNFNDTFYFPVPWLDLQMFVYRFPKTLPTANCAGFL